MKSSSNDVTRLSDFLCFAVYSANLAFGKVYKPVLEQLGLTYPQYIAIVALWEEDNQTVGSLGEKMFLESNTLTPLLKKLEAMGYVERRRDTEDERLVRVTLTKSGRQLREKQMEATLSEALRLGPKDVERLQKSIVLLRDNLLDAVEARSDKKR
ncbi:MarR family winged helix-turn-helix transcriptional regulator [Cupriavidus pampae]|uniref:HTH marR-type domain-containing protein n=1 Tax=Cupriavidus pampae TaxID=659251 RepID=A0ABN7Y425_9BURK|nr:MarR family transcriptional regulator [Cupriavidus pampae]CAG9166695.1 hypothetical protein LMG32289_01137 [Cupriavidus pampae]